MRSTFLSSCLVALTLVALVPEAGGASERRFGLGGHYWRTLDDVADDNFRIDEDGIAPVVSYQWRPGGLVSFELAVEFYPDGFAGSAEESFAPTLFVLVGKGLYGGAGVGVTVSDGLADDVSDPFYAARLGWVMELLPRIYLDLNLNYRVDTFSELEDVGLDSDSLTLGAAVRFGF